MARENNIHEIRENIATNNFVHPYKMHSFNVFLILAAIALYCLAGYLLLCGGVHNDLAVITFYVSTGISAILGGLAINALAFIGNRLDWLYRFKVESAFETHFAEKENQSSKIEHDKQMLA